MTGDKPYNWSHQVLQNGKVKPDYWPGFGKLTVNELRNHFNHKIKPIAKGQMGCIALNSCIKDDWDYYFCADADSPAAVDAIEKRFIPLLNKYDIDYIYEHGGTSGDKCHLWIMTDCKRSSLKILILFLMRSAGINYSKLGLELYHILKKSNVIRLPGGFHLKNKQVNAITYEGKTSNDSVFIIESFLKARILTEERVQELIKDLVPEIETTKPRRSFLQEFTYESRNLSIPDLNFPPTCKKLGKECQAIREQMWEWSKGSLDIPGDTSHKGGRYLNNIALYDNITTNSTVGTDCLDEIMPKLRSRDWKSHNWLEESEKALANLNMLIPRCETLEDNFNACENCPFKGKIHSPSQLLTQNNDIVKTLIEPVKLVSPTEVRKETFMEVKQSILDGFKTKDTKNILLASPMGSGKSVLVSNVTSELAKLGAKVLIAVPTGELAKEHKERLEALGHKAFVLLSHNSIFKLQKDGKTILEQDFECPDLEYIQFLEDLGVSSQVYKKQVCKNCPFYERCPYPTQYGRVEEEHHNIVIIQHAHFSVMKALYHILEKKFDVLFVDESFLGNTIKTVKVSSQEMDKLESFTNINWVEPLLSWLRVGGYPSGKINATEEELTALQNTFKDDILPWNIPEYIRFFNDEYYYDTLEGINAFYPIPQIPIRVFTDATPPLEYFAAALDTEDIEIYGYGEVLDYRLYNKQNKVIQVLDSSCSKSSLSKNDYEKFIEILEFIGDKVRHEYKTDRVLITTYKDSSIFQFTTVAKTWLEANYPDIMDRVDFNNMSVGTNAFEEHTVQFLVSGVYLSEQQYKKALYDFNNIKNFWNKYYDRPLIPNIYHESNTATFTSKWLRVNRILPDSSPQGAGLYEIPGYAYVSPKDPGFDLIQRYMISKTQQSIRLRFKDDKQKIVYIFGNYNLPSFLVTDSVRLSSFTSLSNE